MVIKEYPNLLTKEECERIIEYANQSNIVPAEVIGPNDDGYRTADYCWIDENHDVILSWVKDFVSKETNSPILNQEGLHVVRYGIGGKYDEHHDWFDTDVDEHIEQLGNSGNRTHSFLIYLNDEFTDGETKFIHQDKIIKPEIGKGLMWTNMVDGNILDESLHAGLPVTDGYKWILIIWVRENTFE